MQFFADTAEIEDIKKLYAMGLLDGITTNPSLIAKSGRQFKDVIKEICGVVPGPVSAEVASTDYDTMMKEAHVLAKLADNVVVKVPLTVDGLRACKALNGEGIKTNVTLCFSPNQALLAAKAGAGFISPFLGFNFGPLRRHFLLFFSPFSFGLESFLFYLIALASGPGFFFRFPAFLCLNTSSLGG